MEADQAFLEFVVKELVDHPEDVKVTRSVDQMGVLLTLDVNAEDMGKVIGRQGNSAKAIRTLLRVVGMKNNARVNLKINEPNGGVAFSGREDMGESASANDTAPSMSAAEVSDSVEAAMEELKF